MSIYASIVTFDDVGDDQSPPLIYHGPDHHPVPSDKRGGMLDVAEIGAGVLHSDAPDCLRVSVSIDDGSDATVLLDPEQVVALYAAVGSWLLGNGVSRRAECTRCEIKEFVQPAHGCPVHDPDDLFGVFDRRVPRMTTPERTYPR